MHNCSCLIIDGLHLSFDTVSYGERVMALSYARYGGFHDHVIVAIFIFSLAAGRQRNLHVAGGN